jgi:PAS domain S-box-containing protein
MSEPVIITNPARCRDCYRCVRICDVKAIRVKEGQIQVVPELCIMCGSCVRICPQRAKNVRSSRQDILDAKKEGRKIVASVAPSAPAFFDMSTFADLEKILLDLGFHAAEETAVGAHMVATAHREYLEKGPAALPVINSGCPVVVNLIEKYNPDLIPHLAPIVSPMIAHGRHLAKKYGPDAYIVFIGPCLAKKKEMYDEACSDLIYAVMTFRGLREWLLEAGINCRRSTETKSTSPEKARLFPIEGGLLGTAGMNTDILNNTMIVASGLEACHDVLNDIRTGQLNAPMVEIMACKGGCVNGPAMANLEGGATLSRQKIIEYYSHNQPGFQIPREEWPPLARTYRDRKAYVPEFSEEQIQEVLCRVNKFKPEDELNCRACGYPSCREKAIASLRGMSDVTMCIPYMRSRSESLRQVVMDVTPNSVIIIDLDLIIRGMSPSAERLFKCKLSEVEGKHLSRLIPVLDDFYLVRDTGQPIYAKRRRIRDMVAEQSVVQVEGQALMVAIIRDITEREGEREKFNALRQETLERTKEVISKQMRVAHEIAHLLGETTAESKTIFTHLAKLLQEEDGN